MIIKQDWDGGCIWAHLLMADASVFIVADRDRDMTLLLAEVLFSRGEGGEGCRNIFSVSCWTPGPQHGISACYYTCKQWVGWQADWRSTKENIRLPTAALSLFILLFFFLMQLLFLLLAPFFCFWWAWIDALMGMDSLFLGWVSQSRAVWQQRGLHTQCSQSIFFCFSFS